MVEPSCLGSSRHEMGCSGSQGVFGYWRHGAAIVVAWLWLLLLSLNFLAGHGFNPECWRGGYSYENCCNMRRFGLGGNVSCWDRTYTFQRCCHSKEEHVAEAPVGEDLTKKDAVFGLWREGVAKGFPLFLKQHPENVTKLLDIMGSGFAHVNGNTGPIILPRRKLLFCAITKNSCTTMKRFLLRLQGVLTPTQICQQSKGFEYLTAASIVHSHPDLIRNFSHWPTIYRECWDDAYVFPQRNMSEEDVVNLMKIFLSREWTTFAVVRDPWYRALSAYHDQKRRGLHHPLPDVTSLEDFLRFTSRRFGDQHHTAEQAGFCGLSYLKYDYLIDFQNIGAGLDVMIQHGIFSHESVHTGWEACTKGGSPNILGGAMVFDDDFIHKTSSPAWELDSEYCNQTVAKAVFRRYRADYAALSRAGLPYRRPHKCVTADSDVSAM